MANPRPPDNNGAVNSSDCSISSPDSLGENVLLTLNPIMTTFKGSEMLTKDPSISPSGTITQNRPRPTPPNTLNIISNTVSIYP